MDLASLNHPRVQKKEKKKKGVCPKLQRKFRKLMGPYKVIERVTDVLYWTVLVEGGQDMIVHYNRLKPLPSPVSKTRNQDGSPRRQTRSPETKGSTGWVRWAGDERPGRPAQRGSASRSSRALVGEERQTGGHQVSRHPPNWSKASMRWLELSRRRAQQPA